MDREQAVNLLMRRARLADSAMVRVLSRDEIEWLAEPLLVAMDPALAESA